MFGSYNELPGMVLELKQHDGIRESPEIIVLF